MLPKYNVVSYLHVIVCNKALRYKSLLMIINVDTLFTHQYCSVYWWILDIGYIPQIS